MGYFDDELIAINLIRQYIFCPRIPWYKKALQFEPPEQKWVKQGQVWHEKQSPRHKRRICKYLDQPYLHKREVYVISKKYGFHGYIDEVVSNKVDCVLVEYKIDTTKPTFAQIMQCTAYKLAAEESLKQKVKAVILLKGSARKQFEIEMNEKVEFELLSILSKLRKSISQPSLPISNAQEAKCAQCEYLRYCNDR